MHGGSVSARVTVALSGALRQCSFGVASSRLQEELENVRELRNFGTSARGVDSQDLQKIPTDTVGHWRDLQGRNTRRPPRAGSELHADSENRDKRLRHFGVRFPF